MIHATYEEWLASRPPIVRELLTKFPPMTTVMLDERVHYVIGADEAGSLLVSPVNPHEDYAAALDEQRVVCREHQTELQVIAVGQQGEPFHLKDMPKSDLSLEQIRRDLRKMLASPFSAEEIRMILKALCPEGGYSKDIAVARLQSKLSIMLEAELTANERHTTGAHDPRR